MKLRCTVVAVAAALGIASPAAATQEATPRTFICDGVALTVVAIDHNNSRSFHVISGADARVFHVTKVLRDGELFFDVPGWEGRTDVTCTDPENPAITGYGFFAPRSDR